MDYDISEENILCALFTADCNASPPGTPYFQTLMIQMDGVNRVFARADPASTQVQHTISKQGQRAPTVPWNKKGNKGGKWSNSPAPSGKSHQAQDQSSGAGWKHYGSGDWWKSEKSDEWAATGKDPWSTPAK